MAYIKMENGQEFTFNESLDLNQGKNILTIDDVMYILIDNKWEVL